MIAYARSLPNLFETFPKTIASRRFLDFHLRRPHYRPSAGIAGLFASEQVSTSRHAASHAGTL
jgi:hypothetical protein